MFEIIASIKRHVLENFLKNVKIISTWPFFNQFSSFYNGNVEINTLFKKIVLFIFYLRFESLHYINPNRLKSIKKNKVLNSSMRKF